MTSSTDTNGKHKSPPPAHRIRDKPEYPAAIKDHLEEDYDPYRNFLVNGNNANPDRSQAMSRSLRSWEEAWDRAKSGAKDNQGVQDPNLLLGPHG
ncbi:hypothetical protein MMC07_003584 [Pseudocyphellaria aurata]|nr:hypothetical protein [Pseudocyphellaria aurata]